jgi:hypothetical protein
LRAGSEESFRKSRQQTCAVAASAVGVYTAAMRKAFERRQRYLDNLITGGTAEAGDETSATGIVIGMAPVWVPIELGWDAPSKHTYLSSRGPLDVQRRICIYQIDFVGQEILSCGLLKLCNF